MLLNRLTVLVGSQVPFIYVKRSAGNIQYGNSQGGDARGVFVLVEATTQKLSMERKKEFFFRVQGRTK